MTAQRTADLGTEERQGDARRDRAPADGVDERPRSEAVAPADEQVPALPRRPLNHRTPFYIAFTASMGVALAYVLVRMVFDAGQVITLVGLALFLAVGLDPAVVWLTDRRVPRWAAVIIVVTALLGFVAAFAVAAVGPITHEIRQLSVSVPRYVHDVKTGRGWIGHVATRLHLSSDLRSTSTSHELSLSLVGGVLGAGKVLLSAVSSTTVVLVLTVYFLVALPAVRRLWVRLMPRSRRARAAELTDEVASRVGGFVLGNLLTSVVAGVGTALWLTALGVPYPILLGLLVALLDLIPVVGSTIGGVIASAVALSQGLPIALATACFYIAYRLFEDYLLTPRVMRHTVRISPGLTIIATLVGGVLLGLIGALIAIPTAAAVQLILEEVTFPSLERR